jgi:hypothetical protein
MLMEPSKNPRRPDLNRFRRLRMADQLPSPAQMMDEIASLRKKVKRLRKEMEEMRLALPQEVAAQVRAILEVELAPSKGGTPIGMASFGTLDWHGKVTAILLEAGMPLRKRAILARLEELSPGIGEQYGSLSGTVSTHLHTLSSSGRISAVRPFGRGVYYALLEWLDGDGRLGREMLARLAREGARP